MKRVTEYNDIESIAEADVLPIVDVSDTSQATSGSTRKTTIEKVTVEILKKVYPIGCIYTSVVGTNPFTIFGFGTWVAFGAGRVPVGFNSGDTDFNSPEKTGGAKTHTLTTAEMPSHTHTQNSHRHNVVWSSVHRISLNQQGFSGYKLNWEAGAGSDDVQTEYTTPTNQNTGGGQAHNNLQPYITVFMWKRTE